MISDDKLSATEVIKNLVESPPEDVSCDQEERQPAGYDNYPERNRSGRPGPDNIRSPDADPVEQQLEYYR